MGLLLQYCRYDPVASRVPSAIETAHAMWDADLVALNVHRCPVDCKEVAEAYCVGLLSPSEEGAFEDHYIVCSSCAAMVERTDVYVRGMQNAVRKLRENQPEDTAFTAPRLR